MGAGEWPIFHHQNARGSHEALEGIVMEFTEREERNLREALDVRFKKLNKKGFSLTEEELRDLAALRRLLQLLCNVAK